MNEKDEQLYLSPQDVRSEQLGKNDGLTGFKPQPSQLNHSHQQTLLKLKTPILSVKPLPPPKTRALNNNNNNIQTNDTPQQHINEKSNVVWPLLPYASYPIVPHYQQQQHYATPISPYSQTFQNNYTASFLYQQPIQSPTSPDTGCNNINNSNNNNNVSSLTHSWISPTQLEQMKHESNELNIVMLDVESCNSGEGPLRAIGAVVASYSSILSSSSLSLSAPSVPNCQIRHMMQWVIQRNSNDYLEEGLKFWKEKASTADRYFNESPLQASAQTIAFYFRRYLDLCWEQIPNMCLLIDDRHTDGILLNQLLTDNGHKPIHYNKEGVYQPYVYVSRDLMRGSFSVLNPAFNNLRKSDLYRSVHHYWDELNKHVLGRSNSNNNNNNEGKNLNNNDKNNINTTTSTMNFPSFNVGMYTDSNDHHKLLGPQVKHIPVWDALQAASVYFRTEDIKRIIQRQLKQFALSNFMLLPSNSSFSSNNKI